jgi:hypothetical protein
MKQRGGSDFSTPTYFSFPFLPMGHGYDNKAERKGLGNFLFL